MRSCLCKSKAIQAILGKTRDERNACNAGFIRTPHYSSITDYLLSFYSASLVLFVINSLCSADYPMLSFPLSAMQQSRTNDNLKLGSVSSVVSWDVLFMSESWWCKRSFRMFYWSTLRYAGRGGERLSPGPKGLLEGSMCSQLSAQCSFLADDVDVGTEWLFLTLCLASGDKDIQRREDMEGWPSCHTQCHCVPLWVLLLFFVVIYHVWIPAIYCIHLHPKWGEDIRHFCFATLIPVLKWTLMFSVVCCADKEYFHWITI